MSATRNITDIEWDTHKADISTRYPSEGLDQVMRYMKEIHGFGPSKAQYLRKFKKWHLKKNSTKDEWKFVAGQIQKRKLEGKESEILIKSMLIPNKKVKKETSRYSLPGFGEGPESASPPETLDGVVVRTPRTESITIIDYTHIPWFQFQDLVEPSFELLRTWTVQNNAGHFSSSYNLPVAMDPSLCTAPSIVPPDRATNNRNFYGGGFNDQIKRPSNFEFASQPSQNWDSLMLPKDDILVSASTDTTNREARSLLGDFLGESIDPDSLEYVSKISSSLDDILIERHDGDLMQHVKKLYGSCSLDTSFQLLRYSIYLSTNNLLSKSKTDKLLAWIIHSGTFWVIEHLLKSKTPTTEIFASNLLLSATRLENIDIVCAIVANGVEIDALVGLYNQSTALQEATERRNVRLVQLFLDAGANPNAHRDNPTQIAPLQEAVLGIGNLEIVRILISAGADVNVPPKQWTFSRTLLGHVATRDNVKLAQMLLRANAQVNMFTGDSETALQGASRCNNIDMVQILLDAGADVDAPAGKLCKDTVEQAVEDDNCSVLQAPIQHAAENNNVELVQILLDAGADVNGFPVKEYEAVISDGHMNALLNEPLRTALQAAVANCNVVLVRLLLSWGADVNARGYPNTALQIAAKAQSTKIVQLLLRNGADVNAAANGSDGRTALQAAAETGNEDVVQILINLGAEVNYPPSLDGGLTAVQAATGSGQIELVQMLINYGANINAIACPVGGRTCLQAAAEIGHTKLVDLLLKSGAEVNTPAAALEDGRTALQAAVKYNHVSIAEVLLKAGADVDALPSKHGGVSALSAAVANGSLELTQSLLQKGANPNGETSQDTPIGTAAKKGATDLVRCLIQAGADVNRRSAYCSSKTSLQEAAGAHNIHAVRTLLDAQADINAPAGTSVGRTALQAAVETGDIEIVRLLLSKGANPNAPSALEYGKTALEAAMSLWPINHDIVRVLVEYGVDVKAAPNDRHSLPLQKAVSREDVELVQIFLDAGADVNAQETNGRTTLLAAVATRNINFVKILLEAGANINAPASSEWGQTALQAAAGYGDTRLIRFLLAHGADVNPPAGKSHGAIALQKAAIGGHIRAALMLLEAGADINAAPANFEGRMALDAAAEHGRLDMVYLLLKNDTNTETINFRCKRAAKLAASQGNLFLAKHLREYKKL